MATLPARPRVAVAISGGVDSLCALLLLVRQKLDVIAFHGLFSAKDSLSPALADVCARLGVELKVFQLAEAFSREVIDPFANGYAAGLTPNPCVACNRQIKFGILQQKALALGADLFATGHYAKKTIFAGRPLPAMATDQNRDQSYFLGQIRQQALERALFPLATLTKTGCRAIVARAGLQPPEPKESQDICFAAGDWQNYLGSLLNSKKQVPPKPGPVMLMEESGPRLIGRHDGKLWRFTQGQRKGLGLPWSEPLYVCGKDMEANILFVSAANGALSRLCRARSLNIFMEPGHWREPLFARLRHRQKLIPAKVQIVGEEMRLEFEKPRLPAAPGQLAAVYDDAGLMLAAGIITN